MSNIIDLDDVKTGKHRENLNKAIRDAKKGRTPFGSMKDIEERRKEEGKQQPSPVQKGTPMSADIKKSLADFQKEIENYKAIASEIEEIDVIEVAESFNAKYSIKIAKQLENGQDVIDFEVSNDVDNEELYNDTLKIILYLCDMDMNLTERLYEDLIEHFNRGL